MTTSKLSPPYRCIGEFFGPAKKVPSSCAILAPGRKTLSYGQLCRHIEYVVSLLNNYGLGRNDRVALVLPNGPEMAVAFLSVISGATCAPLNPAYQEKEFDFYLSDINAVAVIVQAGMASPVRSVAKRRGLPVIDLVPLKETEAGLFTLNVEDKISPNSKKGLSDPDDIALVLHTSGTTSRPKIVPLTQLNIFASAYNVNISLQLSDTDRCLNVMPLFHIHGLIAALLSSLTAGGSVICTSGFSDEQFIGWIKRLQPTWYTAVPTIHQIALELVEKSSLSAEETKLRLVRSSSSSLPPSVMAKMEKAFKVPVIEAYGMTEAAHQMACNPLPPMKQRPGSVGLPAGPEVSIMDDHSNILLNGETGEIVIRGENVMKGYENNAGANEKAFSGGWFRTGDLGHIDYEGYLYISGRLKEIINRGGQKISPREIDEVLLEHPAVSQAVAFGMPHRSLGEAVAAVIVKRVDVTERELRQHVAERLAPYKIPQQIVFVESIPKGPTGKVQRIGLAEKLIHLLKPEYVPPETEMEVKVAKFWREILEPDQIGRHDNFFALGGDSLRATQVMVRLVKALNLEIPPMIIFQMPTVALLAAELDRLQEEEEEVLELMAELRKLPAGEAARLLQEGVGDKKDVRHQQQP